MQKNYTISGDRIGMIGIGLAGEPFPEKFENHDVDQLIWDGNQLIAAQVQSTWLVEISEQGKPIKRHPKVYAEMDWQQVNCHFKDELIQEADVWRVKNDSDRQKEVLEKAQADFVANLRRQIAQNVGDTESLLGTVSDATGLLIAIALADVVALSSTTTYSAYKKAKLDTLKLLAGDADIAALAGSALGQIQSGDAVLTASLKGLGPVLTEILTRSTGVATIWVQANKAQAEGE